MYEHIQYTIVIYNKEGNKINSIQVPKKNLESKLRQMVVSRTSFDLFCTKLIQSRRYE